MTSDNEMLKTLMTNAYLPLADCYEDDYLAQIGDALGIAFDEIGDCSIKLSCSLSDKLGRQFFDVYISLAEMDEIRLFAFSEPTSKYETAEEALNSFCDVLSFNDMIIDEMIDKLVCVRQMDELEEGEENEEDEEDEEAFAEEGSEDQE